MKNLKVRITCLLLVWLPILLFSLSDLDRDAKELEEKLNDANGIFMSLNKIGNWHFIHEQYREAAALTNTANVYSELKDYPMALKFHISALAIYKEIGLRWCEANSCLGIGNTYTLMGKYEKAKQHLESALEKAKEIKSQSLIMQICKSLSRLHKARGDFKPAVEYFDQFMTIKDSLFNKTNNKQVDLMKVKYETRKKENELLLLRKTNERQQMVKLFLAIGVLLSLGLLLVLYSQYHIKKKTNQLLCMGEARYRSLFSQAGDAIFLIDDNTIIDCNQRALEMFDLTRRDTLGQSFTHFPLSGEKDKPHDPGEIEKRIEETLAGNPQRFYRKYSKKDGAVLDTMVSLAAVTVDKKKLIQATLHDISDRRQLEEEQIKSAKLEATSLIAAGVAHDFNNLLSIIMTNLEMANKEAGPNHKVKPILSQLEKSAHSALALSEKFFTTAKSEFHPREILSIESILRETIDLVLQNSNARVQCSLKISTGLWPFFGDVKQVKRVIEHLTQNALDAMGTEGEIEVKADNIELKKDEMAPLPAGRYVIISVKDNGEGIPEGNLARIFDAYFTTREEYTRKGLGMGLTIAQAIIKRHRGTITVSSQPGTGTIFHIYLPASS